MNEYISGKMSLRHLYRDINSLGIYPDIIKGNSNEELHGYITLNTMMSINATTNKYYGKIVIIRVLNDRCIMRFVHMSLGIMHDLFRPSYYHLHKDVKADLINKLIRSDIDHDDIQEKVRYKVGKRQ